MVSPLGRILRADIYAYTLKCTKGLEQLVARHRMVRKIPNIIRFPDVPLDEYDVRMNKWGDELKEFMLSAEKM